MRVVDFFIRVRDRVAAFGGGAISFKLVSYAMVGVINTIADMTLFFLLLNYVTSSLIVANITSWVIVVSLSYRMNTLTTFAAETGGKLAVKEYAGFVVTSIVGITATTTTLVIAANYMPVMAAKILSSAVSFAVNFSINNLFVFRRRAVALSKSTP